MTSTTPISVRQCADFCAFYRKVDDADAYVLDREVLLDKIRETVSLGGDQILLQGGLHPHLKLEWYKEMFPATSRSTSPRSTSKL